MADPKNKAASKAAKSEERAAKRAKRKNTRGQIWQAFKMQRERDNKLIPLMILCVLGVGLLFFLIGLLFNAEWFMLVTAFGSLFMVAGKRYAEIIYANNTGAKIRKSLQYYTTTYLRFIWTLSATAVVIFYGLWAFDKGSDHDTNVAYAVSMVPFTIAILRYAADVDRGQGGAPDEIALEDRTLQVLALAWLACIAMAVYIMPLF